LKYVRSEHLTFHINRSPNIGEIAQLADFAKGTPFAERVGKLSLFEFRLAEDRQRDAFMFRTNPLARETALQDHYLLYFMRHWFDVRSKGSYSVEVSFYDFPPSLEADRKRVEQCFGQAARVYGRNGANDASSIFDPVFCTDNWCPG